MELRGIGCSLDCGGASLTQARNGNSRLTLAGHVADPQAFEAAVFDDQSLALQRLEASLLLGAIALRLSRGINSEYGSQRQERTDDARDAGWIRDCVRQSGQRGSVGGDARQYRQRLLRRAQRWRVRRCT